MRVQVGKNIRNRRKELGMTQDELAAKLFDDPARAGYISTVESGRQGNIKVERLAEFAAALECHPATLLLSTSCSSQNPLDTEKGPQP